MPLKVVVQVSDLNSVPQALKSCRNLLSEVPDAVVEIVFHQTAINALVKGKGFDDEIRGFVERGVVIAACRNSMRDRGIRIEDLVDGVTVVNSGVAEIVKKESEGWLYLRL